MATTSTSLKEYLKKYESNAEDEKKQKKREKKKMKPVAAGVLVVDEDPVWQKPVKLDEVEENDSPDEKPLIDEDIEVKRMKRLEQIRARRSYNQISEDGSGWVSISDAPRHSEEASTDSISDIAPPRKRVARYDTPSPEHGRESTDLSPPRLNHRRKDSPSPEPNLKPLDSTGEDTDMSPPRQIPRSVRLTGKTPSMSGVNVSGFDNLSPARKNRVLHVKEVLPPPSRRKEHDLSPPRRSKGQCIEEDLSPPRKRKEQQMEIDLSPPRKGKGQQRGADLSSPKKKKEQQKTGLITGKDVREEIAKTKKDEWYRFNEMDPTASGRGAEAVYRIKGERVTKEEYLKLTKKEPPPKEGKKLEWGKGLAQKREAEASIMELELEKEKPFARSRDDPELDRMMKEKVRWGDPMANLVKKKQHGPVLPNLGDDEKMKESGFIVPQEIPSHSWIKRGVDAPANRYGIKPGRHWDGVDRSNGYEKQLFRRMNEKRATEREAYLWSVSDM